MQENGETQDEEFNELVRQAHLEQQSPRPDVPYQRTAGCFGGCVLGLIVSPAWFFVLVSHDQIYLFSDEAYPFMIKVAGVSAVFGLVFYPSLARRIKKLDNRRAWVLLPIIGLILAGGTSILLLDTHKRKVHQVFTEVVAGVYKSDRAGVVTLPANLSSVSCNGRAYLTRKGSLVMVFLPTWLGKGANVAGYLICNRPLRSKDMQPGQYPGSEVIVINYPQLLGLHGPYGADLNEVGIEQILSQNTYFVFNNLS